MTAGRRIVVLVVAVLLFAAAVFALRSWVGLDPADDSTPVSSPTSEPAPTATATTAERSPSPSPEPDPTPTPTPAPTAATPTPSPSPTARPAERLSTSSVQSAIRSRTQLVSGRGTTIGCPDTVSASVGTTFACTVAYANEPATVVADATVRITGPGGRFVWQSRSRR